MSRALPFVAFGIGAVAGAAASWYFAKKKYEQIAQEEIDSVKQVFSSMKAADLPKDDIQENDMVPRTKAPEPKDDRDMMTYATKLNEEGYTNYSNMEIAMPDVETEKFVKSERPYIISPEEFDELDDYEAISLTYYADDVLADDMDYPVEDVDSVVGTDFASHFGEYEDDSVFVRNDRLKADYEILKDERYYSDVRNSKPYL